MANQDPNQLRNTNTAASVYRPTSIEGNPRLLRSEVGLFGTCGDPASTWRQDLFIPLLESHGLAYFNPQVGVWTPERAPLEADRLATDQVVAMPISKETAGYGTLGEAGWAVLGALMRGQKLGMYVETGDAMSVQAQRARRVFMQLADIVSQTYPVFYLAPNMEELASWAAVTGTERAKLHNSQVDEIRVIHLPTNPTTNRCVSIFGTPSLSPRKRAMLATLEANGIPYYDSYDPQWDQDEQQALQKENQHQLTDYVQLQIITDESESFGALAQSGWQALLCVATGRPFALHIADYPSDPGSNTNRTRALVRAHAERLNHDFPNLIYLASSPEDAAEFAIRVMKGDVTITR